MKEPSKFSTQRHVEELVWQMRLADLPRSENRAVLNDTYNGQPPFDPRTAEENNIEVNRNFLEGTGTLTDARTQWNANFLKPGNIFTVRLDCGPVNKREEWGTIITKHINRGLRRSLPMVNNIRETGAGVLLHGIGPSYWSDRRSPVPKVMPISSLMIPSETDIDFENLEYFAIFREMTPSQLYEKTHGPKRDPGWNMKLVDKEIEFIGQQVQKQTNATAYQFMPERIAEIIKQDIGFWGSDAVPTVDYWDFYFREKENGCGWYRRIFLDWGASAREVNPRDSSPPQSPSDGQWLYDSGKRKYADSWQEIMHCNFGDCSCVAPFKYHSVRSLGWMIWGVVDIMNKMDCKTTEQAFSDLMWLFRASSGNDLNRIKKANFLQFGVMPAGIDFVKGNERFTPNPTFIELVMNQNRNRMSQHSSSFTRNAERSDNSNKEKTATQVMAEVNSINTMVGGVMTMASTYETFKDREICRRFCIPNNPDPMVRKFRKACLEEGVPEDYLEIDKWDVESEIAIGAGNKTIQMAIVQYLNGVRANLGPEAQRKVDHLGILTVTDDASMAEDLAPVKGQEPIGRSTHDAELATERLMRGLQFSPTPQMVYEDYVIVWLRDMGAIIKQIQAIDHTGSPEEVFGLQNMATHISTFLQIMGQSDEGAEKAKQYSDLLGQLMNVVKGFQQRLAQQAKAGNGNGQMDESQAKNQAMIIDAESKAKIKERSHALTASQKQAGFEMTEARKDRELNATIRRDDLKAAAETATDARVREIEAATKPKQESD